MHEYPKALYRTPGPLLVDGVDCDMLIVDTAEAEDAACADGWSAGLPQASVTNEAEEVDEKSALIADAEALGIAVDKRWGLARLRSEIEAAQ